MSHEWLKVLASALAGMFAGLIADPIRESFSMHIKAYRMERAIRLDRINVKLREEQLRGGTLTAPSFWSIELFPSFKYYWDKNREYFYVDFRLQRLCTQLHATRVLEEGVRKGEMKTEVAGPKLIRTLERIDEILDETGATLWQRSKGRLFRLFS